MMSLINETQPILFAGKSSQSQSTEIELAEENSSVGSLIKEARQRKGLSQKELALRCDITPVQLCRIENNENIPSKKSLQKISGHIGLPYSTLLVEAGYNNMSGVKAFYKQDGTELNVGPLIDTIYKADSDLLDYFQDFEHFGSHENVEVLKLLLLAMRKEADPKYASQKDDLVFKHFKSVFQALKRFIISSLSPIFY